MQKKIKVGTAKAIADAKAVDVSTDKPTAPKAKQSDMWTVYNAVLERFDAEEIAVNSDNDPNRVEIEEDFVKDCSAMISERMGTPPEYAPYNFEAKVTCVVVKGNDTGLRLDLLKQAVRNALMKEPLDFGTFQVSTVVTDEADSKVIGFRQSVITLNMQAERKTKGRW
jgi:hypothetical protein